MSRLRRKQIAIVTIANDLHAYAIRSTLKAHPDVDCHIIECDRLATRPELSWQDCPEEEDAELPSVSGTVRVDELDVVWWRRANAGQFLPSEVTDSSHKELIDNDSRTALIGIMTTRFNGRWISDPAATMAAENKLVQLRAAQRVGFTVPRTLVSQNPMRIRQFCSVLDNEVVVKAVKGTPHIPVFCTRLRREHLANDNAMRLCPTIYQEYVPGNRHLRVCSFGEKIFAALIESEEVDWRTRLDVPVSEYILDEAIRHKVEAVRRLLNLEMGIFDLKLTDNDDVVWLEVNAQGQFLFLEGLCGIPLAAHFAEFLNTIADEALKLRTFD